MADQIDNIRIPETYRIPQISLIITTYELTDKKEHITPGENPYEWLATVTHIFHGETIERVHQILDAHRKTDVFFDGSFKGEWNGIILRNSEPQIM